VSIDELAAEFADFHAQAVQEAHVDGFRHGLGVAIQTLEFAGAWLPEAFPPEFNAAVAALVNSVAQTLREASAKFTMDAGEAS
jgi:hypothetical protein